MKKKVKKLSLHRETLRELTHHELREPAGGAPTAAPRCVLTDISCYRTCTC